MTERIDHALATREYLDERASLARPFRASGEELAAVAQVHATLALVEQQRIANLIALSAHANERFGNYAGEAGGIGVLFSYGKTDASNMQVRDEIREALEL